MWDRIASEHLLSFIPIIIAEYRGRVKQKTLDEIDFVWYTIIVNVWKGGIPMFLQMLENSVATGDNRNIVLWIVLAAAALILIVLSAAMSVMKKHSTKSKKKGSKTSKHKD